MADLFGTKFYISDRDGKYLFDVTNRPEQNALACLFLTLFSVTTFTTLW